MSGITHEDPKLIAVRWVDSESQTGWDTYDHHDIEDEVLVTSVGWLVAENEHTLMLTADSGSEEDYNRMLKIPIVCVRQVNVITEGRKLS